jgi:hypothetical protein
MIRFGINSVTRTRPELFDVFPLAREFLNSHEAHYRRTEEVFSYRGFENATREAGWDMRMRRFFWLVI